jgi:cytochrome P450
MTNQDTSDRISPTLLLDPEVIDDPYPFYARLRREAPVWPVGDSGIFAVSTFELVAEATGRVDDFSSNLHCLMYRDDRGIPARWDYGDGGGQALATADPPLHALHRRAVFPELVARRMNALEPEILDLATAGITRALELGTVDFMADIGNQIPIRIITRLIGFQGSDVGKLLDSAFETTAMLGSALSLHELIDCIGRTTEIGQWIQAQLAASIREPGDDLLGAVARAIHDNLMSEFEGYGILHTLLSAGGESTTSLLGNAVRLLAEDHGLQAQLREQPELIAAFIEEVLRVESPFRYLMRSAHHDTTLGGVHIPAGSTVLLLWGAANHDEREYEHPDIIDLERTPPKHHLAFGRGIHFCVGAPLARLEARIVLAALLERTSSLTLNKDRRSRWVHSLMIRRHEELPITLVGR